MLVAILITSGFLKSFSTNIMKRLIIQISSFLPRRSSFLRKNFTLLAEEITYFKVYKILILLRLKQHVFSGLFVLFLNLVLWQRDARFHTPEC